MSYRGGQRGNYNGAWYGAASRTSTGSGSGSGAISWEMWQKLHQQHESSAYRKRRAREEELALTMAILSALE